MGHPDRMDIGHVVVVRTAEGQVDTDELRRFLVERFAKFEIPDRFVFVDKLPKTSVGKFDKKVLRGRVSDGSL